MKQSDNEKGLGRLKRQSLPHEIARVVERMIFQEKFKSGEQIREMHLASMLGTSQAPVREALRILEQRGVVMHTPSRGTSVVSFGEQDAAQILRVRSPLEVLALDLARLNATEDDQNQLKEDLEELGLAADRDDLLIYHEAHMRFHELIWRASGNPHLVTALQRLCAPLWAFYRQRVRSKPSRSLSGRRTHQPLLDFITSTKDQAKDARTLVQEHFHDVAGFDPADLTAQ